MDYLIDLYKNKSKDNKNEIKFFNKFIEDMINNMDINDFEKVICKIINDNYIISINGISYKLNEDCRKCLNTLKNMFSMHNINNPVNDYSNNEYVCNFLENIKNTNVNTSRRNTTTTNTNINTNTNTNTSRRNNVNNTSNTNNTNTSTSRRNNCDNVDHECNLGYNWSRVGNDFINELMNELMKK